MSLPAEESPPDQEFREDCHDWLSRYWPEPREQLHAEDWKEIRRIVSRLAMVPGEAVLDICCGERGTVVWLVRSMGVRVFGVDLLEPALMVARERAQGNGVDDICTFL